MDSRVALQIDSYSDKVRRFIAEYASIDPKQVTDEMDFTEDLGLDWLDQLELMVRIEDEFVGIDFLANTTATQIRVVGDLIRYIEHHSVVLARRSAA
jgi:acyl carrier protein